MKNKNWMKLILLLSVIVCSRVSAAPSLMRAAMEGNTRSVSNYLMDDRITPQEVKDALMAAAEKGQSEVVLVLLKREYNKRINKEAAKRALWTAVIASGKADSPDAAGAATDSRYSDYANVVKIILNALRPQDFHLERSLANAVRHVPVVLVKMLRDSNRTPEERREEVLFLAAKQLSAAMAQMNLGEDGDEEIVRNILESIRSISAIPTETPKDGEDGDDSSRDEDFLKTLTDLRIRMIKMILGFGEIPNYVKLGAFREDSHDVFPDDSDCDSDSDDEAMVDVVPVLLAAIDEEDEDDDLDSLLGRSLAGVVGRGREKVVDAFLKDERVPVNRALVKAASSPNCSVNLFLKIVTDRRVTVVGLSQALFMALQTSEYNVNDDLYHKVQAILEKDQRLETSNIIEVWKQARDKLLYHEVEALKVLLSAEGISEWVNGALIGVIGCAYWHRFNRELCADSEGKRRAWEAGVANWNMFSRLLADSRVTADGISEALKYAIEHGERDPLGKLFTDSRITAEMKMEALRRVIENNRMEMFEYLIDHSSVTAEMKMEALRCVIENNRMEMFRRLRRRCYRSIRSRFTQVELERGRGTLRRRVDERDAQTLPEQGGAQPEQKGPQMLSPDCLVS